MSAVSKISLDNVESIAMIVGIGIVGYAAYRAYKVADDASNMVSNSVAAVADKVSAAYNGLVSAASNAYAEVDIFTTGQQYDSPGPLDEAQTTANNKRFASELWALQQKRIADADYRGLNNPMGDVS